MLHFGPDGLLDVKVLGHGFDDEVHVRHAACIVGVTGDAGQHRVHGVAVLEQSGFGEVLGIRTIAFIAFSSEASPRPTRCTGYPANANCNVIAWPMVPVPTFAIVLISSTVSITETPSFRRFVWRWCTHEQHRAVMRLLAFYADFAT